MSRNEKKFGGLISHLIMDVGYRNGKESCLDQNFSKNM